jgi:hypothetical protein
MCTEEKKVVPAAIARAVRFVNQHTESECRSRYGKNCLRLIQKYFAITLKAASQLNCKIQHPLPI